MPYLEYLLMKPECIKLWNSHWILHKIDNQSLMTNSLITVYYIIMITQIVIINYIIRVTVTNKVKTTLGTHSLIFTTSFHKLVMLIIWSNTPWYLDKKNEKKTIPREISQLKKCSLQFTLSQKDNNSLRKNGLIEKF